MLGEGGRLGRLWPTIGLAIRIVLVGLIFGLVFGMPSSDYVPWLATGWAIWGMIGSTITGMASTFIQNKSLLIALPIPQEAFVLKVIVKESLLLVQNAILVIAVAILFQLRVGFEALLVVPGFLLTTVFLYGLGLTISPLVSRYKDFGPLISSIISVMFFVLPVMWKPDSIQSDLAHLILGLNPLYHYLQIVRLPLLGDLPTVTNYALAASGAAVFLAIGMFVIRKTRHKIVYWS